MCRLQTIGEGWAAPLKGFMREGALVQALHHNRYIRRSGDILYGHDHLAEDLSAVRSVLVDPYNVTGSKGVLERKTEWNGEREKKKLGEQNCEVSMHK